ncbi:altronate hydrolase [Pullulanibacillus pueri]|uniref:Altronate hydrolase n=1 Tax=Pullulanibacillus pueri TaxID=1437324 RepID=A0A8J3ENZ2_9BACL|nr:altronate dehydratase family protein [Pullulanibacillus pueri]MBM7682993.1 altronate hydrolase [Pullulanibacillus pueri]GGH85928.1 altronate hydrolase [Pullulanibacillus pueri]
MANNRAMVIHPNDSVFIALEDLSAGDVVHVNEQHITLISDVPSGHKVALKAIPTGEKVMKYGYPIGVALEPIEKGEWIHTHNIKTTLDGPLNYAYTPDENRIQAGTTDLTFQGFLRPNGEVGIRNEVWIINTVGCINKTAESIARLAGDLYKDRNIDGIYHYPHPFGCSQLGDDLLYTQKLLGNLVNHPNAGGVLVIGLGCENNFIESFKESLGDYKENRVKFIESQWVDDEIADGIDLIGELIGEMEKDKRQPISLSKLKVGLKCGGSDGFSGITANPLVGEFSNLLIQNGGTTILTEVPEMFGAETILMNRAANERIFSKTVNLINGFKDYFIQHQQPIYENPSPGNKKGGISTLEEKSLGCVQKGGIGEVVDVIDYGEKVSKQGLNLVQGPGNDLVSVTALAAAGAHIVLFTTGRGTPFGGPVPTVKISTNSQIYTKKKNWIDFNAGELLENKNMDQLKQAFFNYVLDIASGNTQTNNEKFGFKEIAIFKTGVTL